MFRKIIIFIYLLICINGYSDLQAIDFKQVKESFVKSQGAELFCRSVGKGNPLIVIHGGPELSQDYLLPQMYELADNNFVIFYDQRGCGRSTTEINSETITIENFINDIEAIRQAFHLDKVSILGHSWGGLLAMHYSIAHPECINKLVLSNSEPASSEGLHLFLQEYLRRIAPYQTELDEIQKSQGFHSWDPDTFQHFYRIIFRTYCFYPKNADSLNLCMTSTALANGANVYKYINKNVFEKPHNLHDSLNCLRIPTLIIHGDFDPIPSITAQNIHKSIPCSKYILMKNCGHFPYVEAPDEYFKHLHLFLSSKV